MMVIGNNFIPIAATDLNTGDILGIYPNIRTAAFLIYGKETVRTGIRNCIRADSGYNSSCGYGWIRLSPEIFYVYKREHPELVNKVLEYKRIVKYSGEVHRPNAGRPKKPVIKTEPDGTETEYVSLREAAKQNGCVYQSIKLAIRDNRPLRGNMWKYKTV